MSVVPPHVVMTKVTVRVTALESASTFRLTVMSAIGVLAQMFALHVSLVQASASSQSVSTKQSTHTLPDSSHSCPPHGSPTPPQTPAVQVSVSVQNKPSSHVNPSLMVAPVVSQLPSNPPGSQVPSAFH